MPVMGFRLSHCCWLQGWLFLSKQRDTGGQVDRLVRATGVATLVGQKAFRSGEPLGVPYFKKPIL